jgi:hypothetical protein
METLTKIWNSAKAEWTALTPGTKALVVVLVVGTIVVSVIFG